MFIVNKSGSDVHGMHNGVDYRFKSGEVKAVDNDAGKHLLQVRPALKELRPEDLVIQAREQESSDEPVSVGLPEPSRSGLPELCDICGKDFGDKEDPAYSLQQHRRAAHKGIVKAAEEIIKEFEEGV